MEIFIIRDGQQAGPFSEDAIQAMLAEGKVRSQDVGWCKGFPSWVPLGELLKNQSVSSGAPRKPDAAANHSPTPGSPDDAALMTPKQKAFLKYLGADFSDGVTKKKAAVAISDALEDPKLQGRIRKWHEEKLRLHPEVFQDELDFRKANRAVRYLERCKTEGAEVVQDVTKAHVQVLIESLDKQHPNWEAESRSALRDYLFPSIAEHFPKLVRPAWKGRLRLGSTSKVAATAAAVQAGLPPTASMPPPPARTGVLMAIARGIVYGGVALGVIIGSKVAWEKRQPGKTDPAPASPPATSKPAGSAAETPEPPAPSVPSVPPAAAVAEKAPVQSPTGMTEPEKPPAAPPIAPAAPPMVEARPPPAAVKAETPPAPATPAAPEKPMAAGGQPEPPAAPSPAPPAPRTSVTLLQGIAVNLANKQVTLPAGTSLKFFALEGANVRVGWNDSVFLVPAVATDVANTPPPAAAPGTIPARKPGDDL